MYIEETTAKKEETTTKSETTTAEATENASRIEKISVERTSDFRTEYYVGESFSDRGIKVFAEYTNGERKADFINCVAWRETAENIARFFRKGTKIGINGSIQTRQYQDRDTGKNRIATEILVDRFHFCEKSEQSQPVNQYAQPQNFAPQTNTYGNPGQNLDINPQPQQAAFQPVQQGFIPQRVPKFQPQGYAQPQPFPAGFEPVVDNNGDLPF